MKKFIFIFIGIAILLTAYNVTFLDFSNITEGKSGVALIGIVTAACAIMLLLILRTSKIIERKKR